MDGPTTPRGPAGGHRAPRPPVTRGRPRRLRKPKPCGALREGGRGLLRGRPRALRQRPTGHPRPNIPPTRFTTTTPRRGRRSPQGGPRAGARGQAVQDFRPTPGPQARGHRGRLGPPPAVLPPAVLPIVPAAFPATSAFLGPARAPATDPGEPPPLAGPAGDANALPPGGRAPSAHRVSPVR